VSLHASAASGSYLFNSRTFGTASSRPGLIVTTTPAPGGACVLGLGAAAGLWRRRRGIARVQNRCG
jgi:uncharacterized protein (TIGR03382 family)